MWTKHAPFVRSHLFVSADGLRVIKIIGQWGEGEVRGYIKRGIIEWSGTHIFECSDQMGGEPAFQHGFIGGYEEAPFA